MQELFDFGTALQLLKQGKSLQRMGWNGKGLSVFLITTTSAIDNNGDPLIPKPFFGIRSNQSDDERECNTWIPSIQDCLAEDWREV